MVMTAIVADDGLNIIATYAAKPMLVRLLQAATEVTNPLVVQVALQFRVLCKR
jgi:hypothetical protein